MIPTLVRRITWPHRASSRSGGSTDVTNVNASETLISDGTLVMSVDGRRYRGTGGDIAVTGNALEHVSEFKLGEEVPTEVFGNTLSRFPTLLLAVNPEAPLRRGITREGFHVQRSHGLGSREPLRNECHRFRAVSTRFVRGTIPSIFRP